MATESSSGRFTMETIDELWQGLFSLAMLGLVVLYLLVH